MLHGGVVGFAHRKISLRIKTK